MLSSFRLQIRKEILAGADPTEGTYVFHDLELPFLPLPGLTVQGFDGQEFRIGEDLVWREGQHRFICYDEPHREEALARAQSRAPRSLEEVIAEYEARGWARNRRASDRLRA